MADTIKIRNRKQYSWQQDNKYIFIEIPNIPAKNTSITMTDLMVIITPEKKKT